MRDQIRQIVVEAIAGTTDLTKAIDQLYDLSNARERSVINPNWIDIKDNHPPDKNRNINYRVILTDVNNDSSIPTLGLGFMHSKWDGNKFEKNHWRLDIMRDYERCPVINILYWAELEEIKLPAELSNHD